MATWGKGVGDDTLETKTLLFYSQYNSFKLGKVQLYQIDLSELLWPGIYMLVKTTI